MTAGSEVATFGNPVVQATSESCSPRTTSTRRLEGFSTAGRGSLAKLSSIRTRIGPAPYTDLKGFSSGSPKNLAECQESCSFARPLLLGNEIILDEGNSR